MDDARNAAPVDTAVKRTDYWWTVLFVDRISLGASKRIVGVSRITPTMLTLTAHLLGMVSAVAFALGWLALAAVLFEIRFVLDCMDGKLARLRGVSSSGGAYLDYVGDVLVVGANMVGLSIWLHWETAAPFAVVLGLPVVFMAQIAVLKSATIFGNVEYSDALPGGYRAWMAARRLHPVPGRVDAENGLLFVLPIAAVALGDERPLTWGAGLATVAFSYLTLRLAWKGYRVAAASDRHHRSPPDGDVLA